MSTNTAISYLQPNGATWDVTEGCSKVSPGCANCWAECLSHRWGWSTKPWTPENAAENVVLRPDRLEEPLRWRKPRRVFVCSRSDLFHEQVSDSFLAAVFGHMADCPQHTFLVLTKRAGRMQSFLHRTEGLGSVASFTKTAYPLPNVWLGVSVENQHWADERIPLLLDTPAAVRWVSAEPLLGPVDLRRAMPCPDCEGGCGHLGRVSDGRYRSCERCGGHEDALGCGMDTGLDWLVVGGESGPGFRPMPLAWADRLSEQCHAADVAYYGKQQAARRQGVPLPGNLGRREFPR